jgi:hypothetical protein
MPVNEGENSTINVSSNLSDVEDYVIDLEIVINTQPNHGVASVVIISNERFIKYEAFQDDDVGEDPFT